MKNQIKTLLIFTLSFVFFACNEDKNDNTNELDETNFTEKETYATDDFSELLFMEPDIKNLSNNNFKSTNEKGFLSNEEAFKIIYSKHSLDDDSKLTLLNYTLIDSKQKWIYRINSTRKLIIKDTKIFEANKKKTTDLNIERRIAEMTTVF